MFEQKTVIADNPEELDRLINSLYKKDYLFVAPPSIARIDSTLKYVQTVVKIIGD